MKKFILSYGTKKKNLIIISDDLHYEEVNTFAP